ncbi:MAG: hypothetical protein II326_07290, partial [Clostridia bacterium]|nr:hypothetical protein [Clostridia bacterium]
SSFFLSVRGPGFFWGKRGAGIAATKGIRCADSGIGGVHHFTLLLYILFAFSVRIFFILICIFFTFAQFSYCN